MSFIIIIFNNFVIHGSHDQVLPKANCFKVVLEAIVTLSYRFDLHSGGSLRLENNSCQFLASSFEFLVRYEAIYKQEFRGTKHQNNFDLTSSTWISCYFSHLLARSPLFCSTLEFHELQFALIFMIVIHSN